jgi:hypothetical protein
MTVTTTMGLQGAFHKLTVDSPKAPKGDFLAVFAVEQPLSETPASVQDIGKGAILAVDLPDRLPHETDTIEEQQELSLDELFPTALVPRRGKEGLCDTHRPREILLASEVVLQTESEVARATQSEVIRKEGGDAALPWGHDTARPIANEVVRAGSGDTLPQNKNVRPTFNLEKGDDLDSKTEPKIDGKAVDSGVARPSLLAAAPQRSSEYLQSHVRHQSPTTPEVTIPTKNFSRPEPVSWNKSEQVAPTKVENAKEPVDARQKVETLVRLAVDRTDVQREVRPGSGSLAEQQPRAAQVSKPVPEKVSVGASMQSIALGFEKVRQEPVGDTEIVRQKASPEVILRGVTPPVSQQFSPPEKNTISEKMPDFPRLDLVAEKRVQKSKIAEPDAEKDRKAPNEISPRELRNRPDFTYTQAIAAPRETQASVLQFEVLEEGQLNHAFDRSIHEGSVSFERLQGIAANTAPIDVKPHQQASVAASVGQQISAAIGHKPDGVTEISLNPEELGRVRFSMKTHEGSVVLIIAAERAETQDIMRKNIESLSQEFKSLGFTDIGFQFQGHGQSRERDNNTGTTIVSDQVPEPAIEIADSENEQIGEDGLDLRL